MKPPDLTHAPAGIRRLALYKGIPIPYTVPVKDGVPDFKGTDPKKWANVVNGRLCAVCGERLLEGLPMAFIGGPRSLTTGIFFDGPMHLSCAKWVFQLCPFVGRGKDYSQATKDMAGPYEASERPPEMGMGVCDGYQMVQLPGQPNPLFQANEWKEVIWDREIVAQAC